MHNRDNFQTFFKRKVKILLSWMNIFCLYQKVGVRELRSWQLGISSLSKIQAPIVTWDIIRVTFRHFFCVTFCVLIKSWIANLVSSNDQILQLILINTRCLKITEKVSFNIAWEASYVTILSVQKLIKNAKNGPFWRVIENLKLAVKQCYQTGQF